MHVRDEKCTLQISVETNEGNRKLRRCRRKQEDNINMNFKLKGYDCVDWKHMTEGSGSGEPL